jgi:hypothetical protein
LGVEVGSTLNQPIKAGAKSLDGIGSTQWPQALINLDAGNDSKLAQFVDHRLAIGVALEQGLFVKNGAANEFTQACCGEEHSAVSLTVCFCVLDTD